MYPAGAAEIMGAARQGLDVLKLDAEYIRADIG